MQRMNQLLGWATQNHVDPSDPNYVPPRPLNQIDPDIIDAILGKPDAVRMKVSAPSAHYPSRVHIPQLNESGGYGNRHRRAEERGHSGTGT